MTKLRKYLGLALYLYAAFYLWTFDLSGDFARLWVTLQEPSVLMVFSFLGLYPMAYALYFLRSPMVQRHGVKASVFGAFFLGAFALEWLMMRPLDETLNEPSRWMKLTAFSLMLFTVLMTLYGVIFGSFSAYWEAFQTVAFVHIMTLDFLVLSLWAWTLKWPDSKLKAVPVIGLLSASS